MHGVPVLYIHKSSQVNLNLHVLEEAISLLLKREFCHS